MTMESLLTLPVHVIYLILDNLDPKDILLSAFNVCSRLNSIINSYQPYQVMRKCLLQCSIISSSMHSLRQQNITTIPQVKGSDLRISSESRRPETDRNFCFNPIVGR